MRKSDKIEQKILDAALWGAAIWGGVALVAHIARSSKGASGIGAAKRRIFKELSLAQKAGVDFTKKFDELDEAEIKALEKVSSDTGYTETYYKSLKKAYDAVSGIGATYDVVNADGNTVLTWTDNPGEQAAAQQRVLEAEARAAESRKRLKKARKAGEQMALFGCGYADTPNYSLSLLNRYLSSVPVMDAQVVLNDTNKQGHYYVLCGDAQGGRDFYLAPKNLPYFRDYCKSHGIEYEQFYLPQDALGYAPEVEAELYEIWREQIEYGNTERDYETWREIYGDEFAKSDVLPYM